MPSVALAAAAVAGVASATVAAASGLGKNTPRKPQAPPATTSKAIAAHNGHSDAFAAGGGAVSAVATSVLLGVRNAFYGLSMAEVLHVRGLRRVVAAQLTIDESTAMAVSRSAEHDGGRASRFAFWATGLSVFVFWNLATLIGAIGANALGDPKRLGLDAAIPAGFIALVWPRLRDRRSWTIGLCAFAMALVLTPFLQPGVPVLLTASVAVVAGVLEVRRRTESEVQP